MQETKSELWDIYSELRLKSQNYKKEKKRLKFCDEMGFHNNTKM